MKLVFSKSSILAVAAIVGLAAATALVAGYVDGPSGGAAVTSDSRCADCPQAGTDACCQVSGACEEGGQCASCCEQSTCEEKASAGCCEEKTQAGCCPSSAGQEQAKPSCGGGCPFSQ